MLFRLYRPPYRSSSHQIIVIVLLTLIVFIVLISCNCITAFERRRTHWNWTVSSHGGWRFDWVAFSFVCLKTKQYKFEAFGFLILDSSFLLVMTLFLTIISNNYCPTACEWIFTKVVIVSGTVEHSKVT